MPAPGLCTTNSNRTVRVIARVVDYRSAVDRVVVYRSVVFVDRVVVYRSEVLVDRVVVYT